MKVVILAGGFGTRLSEETDIRPKPMVPVSPSRLGPVAKSLGNAARYYQKVYRMTPLANQNGGIPVLFNEADHSFMQLHQDACPALFEEIANPVTFSKENVPIPAVFVPRDCRLLIEHPNFVKALNPLTICSPVPVLAKINGELRLVTGYDRDSGIHAAGEVQIPSWRISRFCHLSASALGRRIRKYSPLVASLYT